MARTKKRTGVLVAWDKSVYNLAQDRSLLQSIAPYIDGVKVGLEAMNTDSGDESNSIADKIAGIANESGLKVMWDAKLHDISNTVAAATRNILQGRSVSMLTVHAAMSDEALRSVARIGSERGVLPLAVTVLTDMDDTLCQELYRAASSDTVRRFALHAKKNGITGLVCSPRELSMLHASTVLDGMTTVIPGIRPTWAAAGDQKRIATPSEAALQGADYLVIGRPILHPPEGMTPAEAAQRIREELDAALDSD